jgi:hypothetical protein
MTLVVSFHSSQSRNELTRITERVCYLHREWLCENSLYTCPEPLHFASSITVQCNLQFQNRRIYRYIYMSVKEDVVSCVVHTLHIPVTGKSAWQFYVSTFGIECFICGLNAGV